MGHFILADCNNFYVSCEKLFNPSLEGKPVVVLSNNDGCVISRSQEAKLLGIPMGVPYFKIKDFCEQMKVKIFSSNFRLYGDISQRVMNILALMAPEMEIYSIDEAFLKFSQSLSNDEIVEICHNLRAMVKRWVGIPISLGIGPSKTLAKAANNLAKKSDGGVVSLNISSEREKILKTYPVAEVWGIGRRLAEKLQRRGIYSAFEFIAMEETFVRKMMGVIGERMLLELRGISCLEFDEPSSKKSITCSRCFGRLVNDEIELTEALATHINTACVKLRNQQGMAKTLHIFLEVQIDSKTKERRYYSRTCSLEVPTNDTSAVIAAAKHSLSRIYSPKESYRKCGIVLLDLIQEENVVTDLFLGSQSQKRTKLMEAFDTINCRFGKGSVFFGAMGTNPLWKGRKNQSSEYSMGSWDSLPEAKC